MDKYIDEYNQIVNGTHYIAIEGDCCDCAFYGDDDIKYGCKFAPCYSDERVDNKSIFWKIK